MNISPDRPIELIKNDALGRKPFVQSVAAAISGWRGNESLTIAISGPWGSGKSSVKNMIRDPLSLSQSAVQVAEFNPWQWAGQAQLAEAFFREIEIALGRSPSADSRKSAAKWRLYSAKLRIGRLVTQTASNMITRVLSLIVGSGLAWAVISKHLIWTIVFLLFTGIIVAGGKVFDALGEFASSWAQLKEAQAAVHETSTEDIKGELRQLLKKLSAPILVIIDDIDRLTAPQIGLLFQLIKANADFPNLIYLLLMERAVIEEALNSQASGDGKYYLGKIVQVDLDLPTIPRGKLIEMLEREILAMLDYSPTIDSDEEDHRLSSALTAISPHVKTIRSVHRFTNTLAFDLSSLRGDASLGVNKIDLLCLAAVKVFHPQVYRQLPKEKTLLTESHFPDYQRKSVNRLNAFVLSQTSPDEQSYLLALLAELFPNFPWKMEEEEDLFTHHLSSRTVTENEALTTLSICHHKNFDRYFEQTIQDGDISAEEFDELIEFLPNQAKTYSRLCDFHQRGILLSVLERLLACVDNFDSGVLTPLLTALFDISDECLPEWESAQRPPTDRLLLFLSSSILQSIQDRTERLETFSKAVETSTGLYLPVSKVALEEPGSKRQAVGGLSETELAPLQRNCLNRIKSWAEAGKLINHPALGYIILRWQEWSQDETCRSWVASQINSKEGLIRICTSLENRHYDQNGMTYSIRLDLLEQIADLGHIVHKLKALNYDALTNKEKQGVDRFHLAMQQRLKNEHAS